MQWILIRGLSHSTPSISRNSWQRFKTRDVHCETKDEQTLQKEVRKTVSWIHKAGRNVFIFRPSNGPAETHFIHYNIRRPLELLFLLCYIFRSLLPRQLILSTCVFYSLAAQHIQRQMSASSGIRKDVKGSSHGLTLYPVLPQLYARIYGRHGGHVT